MSTVTPGTLQTETVTVGLTLLMGGRSHHLRTLSGSSQLETCEQKPLNGRHTWCKQGGRGAGAAIGRVVPLPKSLLVELSVTHQHRVVEVGQRNVASLTDDPSDALAAGATAWTAVVVVVRAPVLRLVNTAAGADTPLGVEHGIPLGGTDTESVPQLVLALLRWRLESHAEVGVVTTTSTPR